MAGLWRPCGAMLRPGKVHAAAQALLALVRRKSDYAAVVAGSGPAGVAVVGNLLEEGVKGRILWVDKSFDAGRVDREWREVPSNTKVKLFVAFAEALAAFRHIVEKAPLPNAVTRLKELDQGSGCSIAHAADMCRMLASGLCESGQIQKQVGTLEGADWDKQSASWVVQVRGAGTSKLSTASSSMVVLCTGSAPNAVPIPVAGLDMTTLDLRTVLAPSKLRAALPADAPATVAVIGASHSGVLCLLNLVGLAQSSHPRLRVKWFTRGGLLYAEEKDGWILYDNTGLKGDAATFAREHLEYDKLRASPVGKIVERVDCSESERELYRQHLPECTHVACATGFSPEGVPAVSLEGKGVGELIYDNKKGGFEGSKSGRLPGLFGAGIAFPEQVTDPAGNTEHAVGMWKFMKYLRRVTGDWVKPLKQDTPA